MNTLPLASRGPRKRRSHTSGFKAQVVAECRRAGVSVASVALAHQLNANQLRRWVQENWDQHKVVPSESPTTELAAPNAGAMPTLVPVSLQVAAVHPTGDIRIVVQRPQATVQINWPATQTEACALFLRGLLR